MKEIIKWEYPDNAILKIVFSSENVLIDKRQNDDIYGFQLDREFPVDAVSCTAETMTVQKGSDILDRVKTIPSRKIKEYSDRCIKHDDAILLPHNEPPLFLTPPEKPGGANIMAEILKYEMYNMPYKAIRVTQYVKMYRKEELDIWDRVIKAIKEYMNRKDQLNSPLELLYFDVDDECIKEVVEKFKN